MKRALVAVVLTVLSSSAAAEEKALRALLHRMDFARLAREVEAMSSPSIEAQALRIYALKRGTAATAAAEAVKLRDAHPLEPWAWFAVAMTADNPLPAGEEMMRLAGDAPDEEMIRLRAMNLANAGRPAEALELLDRHPATTRLTLARVNVLEREPPGKRDEARMHQLLDEILVTEPDNVEALYSRAMKYGVSDSAKARALYERAVKLTPAGDVHYMYWRSVRGDRELTREQKQAIIEADIAELRKTAGETPSLLDTLAHHYEDSGDVAKAKEMRERLVEIAPESTQAQYVLLDRIHEATDPAEKKKAALALVEHPRLDPAVGAYAWQAMLGILKDDPQATAAELLRAIDHTRIIADRQPSMGYATPAVILADRGLALDRAEQLAREGLAATEKYLEKMRTRIPDPSEFDRSAAGIRGIMTDALGWVLFQRGRFVEAEQELAKAWALNPTVPAIAHHLGRYYESQRMHERAEEVYRIGMMLQTPGKNPNGDALKKLYERRHGSMAGWEQYLEESKSAELLSRRKRVLAERRKEPRSAPDFALRTLDGKRLALGDLKGKVAVVNFWGIWCGWCVKEMPDYQKLAEKYANDPGVRILTINNDGDADKVKKWMAEKKYDFAVLLDDNFVNGRIRSFPTTWFIDPSGNIAFEQRGWTEKLVEEFTWRIEALR